MPKWQLIMDARSRARVSRHIDAPLLIWIAVSCALAAPRLSYLSASVLPAGQGVKSSALNPEALASRCHH